MTPLLAQRSRVDRSFERLYHRHVADVYRYALAVLRNPADAEDVTQTTFLNAYRAYQRGERPQAAQNWLIAIAHNVCRQRFRQSTRRPQEVAFEDDVADTIVDHDAPSAEDLRNALGHLAFNQRAALVMRELEGRSYAEIGEILGLSVSALSSLFGGGGGAAVGAGIAAKAAAVVAAGALVGGVGYEGAKQVALFKGGAAPVARAAAVSKPAPEQQPVSNFGPAGSVGPAVPAPSGSAKPKAASAKRRASSAKSAPKSAPRASSRAKSKPQTHGQAQRSASSSNAAKSNGGSKARLVANTSA